MTRKLLLALLVMAAVSALAGWLDLMHLLAAGIAALVLLAVAVAIGALRRRSTPDDMEAVLDEEEPGLTGAWLRDGLAGLAIGGAGLAVSALVYAYALPPFYPLLVGDCPRLLPALAIYEDAASWPKAVALIDARLKRPLDRGCYGELAARKARYLIEWSRSLPRDQADAKLAEAESWAHANQLGEYITIAQLMRAELQPTATPPPLLVTPTPSPVPTPRTLAAGSTVQLTGLDLTFFPPTAFAYLRVAGPGGQAITDLTASDVRVEDDGRPVTDLTLSHYSQAPAPICAALVIDYSGSMAGEPLAAAKAGARAFLGLLGPKDQAEIIGFNDKPQLLQAWTTDKLAAGQALELLPARDWTALRDAIYQAGTDLATCSGRKVVVLLSDGADNRSQHTTEQVVEQARRAGLSLFVIGLRTADYDGPALKALVQAVGGRYAEATSPTELEEYYRQTAGAIRSEYRLSLNLDRAPDSASHTLRFSVGGPQPIVVEQAYQDKP